jgi:hypothetical protein
MIKNISQLDKHANNKMNEYTLQYYNLNQWSAFVDISYLLTHLCWLPEANTIYKRLHAVSSITITFTVNFCLLKHMKYGYFIIWKLQKFFIQRVKKKIFLRLTKDNLPSLDSPNLQTFRWSKQNIPRIQIIGARIPLYYGRKSNTT